MPSLPVKQTARTNTEKVRAGRGEAAREMAEALRAVPRAGVPGEQGLQKDGARRAGRGHPGESVDGSVRGCLEA